MKEQGLGVDLDFDALLLKLGDKANNVCLLSGEDDGWESRIAWNPCAKFVLDETTPISELHRFVKNNQKKSYLLSGFISYELGYSLHGLEQTKRDDLHLPLAVIFAYDNYLEKADGKIVVKHRKDGFPEEVKNILKQSKVPVNGETSGFEADWSHRAYGQAFAKTKHYIRDGVIYQINLTQRLQADTTEKPRQIYAKLSANNKAKMKAYIEGDGFEIISMSPERFIKIKGESIMTSPIKGTRPRGNNAQEDEKNLVSLINDEKEKAELNMITDLLRNDLGKVCETGSVTVAKERETAKLSKVMHTFSVIKGRLGREISPAEALLSMFPGGSITGCPKRKAMEIIDELEPDMRGAYCGSVFCIDDKGDLDSSILIRTLIKKGSKLILPVGSGIVYDSVEHKEYQENLDKAVSITEVLS